MARILATVMTMSCHHEVPNQGTLRCCLLVAGKVTGNELVGRTTKLDSSCKDRKHRQRVKNHSDAQGGSCSKWLCRSGQGVPERNPQKKREVQCQQDRGHEFLVAMPLS